MKDILPRNTDNILHLSEEVGFFCMTLVIVVFFYHDIMVVNRGSKDSISVMQTLSPCGHPTISGR